MLIRIIFRIPDNPNFKQRSKVMAAKKIYYLIAIFSIITMRLSISPAFADGPTTENKTVIIDKKAAAIEQYKAELAAKATKKTESIEAKTTEAIIELKDVIQEKAEDKIVTTETNPEEIKNIVTETNVEESSKVEDEEEATSGHTTEVLEEKAESMH